MLPFFVEKLFPAWVNTFNFTYYQAGRLRLVKERMMFKNSLVIAFIIMSVSSCIAPRDLTDKVVNKPLNKNCPELNYYVISPTLSFNDWLPDFNKMISDLPSEVKRNQMASVGRDSIKENYWCFPSARPFVQIDTSLSLKNNSEIIGDWRIRCSRTVEYKDSVSYKDSTFNRSNKLIRDNSDDILVRFTDSKIKFYVKTVNSTAYNHKFTRDYKILNGRYLLIYNLSTTTSGTAFVGITNDNFLIWNQYSVNMDTYYDVFKRWKTTAHQMIFEKL